MLITISHRIFHREKSACAGMEQRIWVASFQVPGWLRYKILVLKMRADASNCFRLATEAAIYWKDFAM
jgi:hypothetical protein